ncbi:uncharacterized protein LOC143279340 [Babylonia areolata]|uniref:uncharacterized protein LOC143279340 n=1 Tax=Babylonia areolata TaxID=304850 RepID=UPI003FD641F9
MAMKTGHQEDSNGNHASHLSVPGNHDNAGPDPHHHHHAVSPDIKAPGDVLQQCVQAEEAERSPVESVPKVTAHPPVPPSRPGQLFRSTGSLTSPEECSDSFCNMASSAVDSDSSSSPDINSNTLLVGFGDSDPSRREADNQTNSVPSCDQVRQIVMDSNKNVSSVIGGEGGEVAEEGGAGVPSQSVTSARGGRHHEQQGDVTPGLCLLAWIEDPGQTAADVCSRQVGRDVDAATQHGSWEGTRFHSALGSGGEYSSSQGDDAGLSIRMTLPSDISCRHSVDMDVDSADTEEPLWVPGAQGSHARAPLPPPQAGPAGDGDSVSWPQSPVTLPPSHQLPRTPVSHSLRPAFTVPETVLTEPSAAEASSRHADSVVSTVEGSSPPVTVLSTPTSVLQGDTTVGDGSLSTTTSSQDGRGKEPLVPSDAETETISFSATESSTQTHYSPPASHFGKEHHLHLQTAAQFTRKSEQSSERSEGRQNGGQSFCPRDPTDAGQEDHVEEELCVYVHQLESRLGEPPTSGDRQELGDPVATLLTEGDHVHFIPIEGECTLNHPAGPNGSADPASHTPG